VSWVLVAPASGCCDGLQAGRRALNRRRACEGADRAQAGIQRKGSVLAMMMRLKKRFKPIPSQIGERQCLGGERQRQMGTPCVEIDRGFCDTREERCWCSHDSFREMTDRRGAPL